MTRVDVIIPCYRYARYLRGCVDSVLGQSGVEVRALILDDASPDDTPGVAAELLRQDGRVEYRRHAVNRGHLATYDEGLEWADGEYTLLLSADDLLAPGALRRAVELMDAHPEVVMTCGRQVRFHTEEPPAARDADEYRWAIVSGAEFLEASCATASNLVATPTPVVRTALQQKLGGYRRELPHTGDMEMWMRFAAHGSVGVVDADQALKRVHGKNMQDAYLATAVGDIGQRQAAFAVLFRDWGHLIPERVRLERLAVRSLAEDAFWLGSRAFDGRDTRRCQDCLDFALELCPELNTRPEWRRLDWKRRLGATVWSWLRPGVDLVRGRGEKTLPAAATSQTPKWVPAGRWQRRTISELAPVG
jgi:glycosyltransferase involved in cell wall biosynthesis